MGKRVQEPKKPEPTGEKHSDHVGPVPRNVNYADKSASKAPESGRTFGKHATMPVLVSDLYSEVALPDLLEFNPDDLKLDGTIVAVGKRRTGKTWVFRNIMYLMKDKFEAGIVISQTDELNHFWRQYVPKKYIYNKYQPEILDAVFKRQKSIINDPNLTDEEKEKKAPFFILLDDVISDSRLKWDENLCELFVAGRHYKLFILITTQYAKAITPTLRGNTDYCFMMKCLQQRQLEALWEDFGSFLTKDAFAQIINAYTEDNEVLVVNTCPDTQVDPLSMMAWWKAVDPGEFKMGSEEYWRAAMMSQDVIPPTGGKRSAQDLLTPKDLQGVWGRGSAWGVFKDLPLERGTTGKGK